MPGEPRGEVRGPDPVGVLQDGAADELLGEVEVGLVAVVQGARVVGLAELEVLAEGPLARARSGERLGGLAGQSVLPEGVGEQPVVQVPAEFGQQETVVLQA